jgi:two-component system, LuxR family, response regulator FixJ
MNGTGPIVFVVDADDAVRDAVAVSLEDAGYSVALFASAAQFLDGYPPGQQGCLVLDLDLPEMDGSELLRVLVARRIALPAIMTSRRLRNHRQRVGRLPGVVAVLEKPFGDRELLAWVEQALRRLIGDAADT